MRPVVGFIALQGILLLAGFGLLRGLGLADRGSRTIPGALGAALLLGTSAVILGLVILLVLGVQFTLLTALLLAIVLAALGFWRGRRSAQPSQSRAPPSVLAAIAAAAAAAYALYGAHAFDRLATVQDDARIWSLKGVALTDYDNLRREIFLSPFTYASHHVYPPFQPLLEALVNRAMGRLELSFFHTELWLLLIATVWAAAYLIWWRTRRPRLEQIAIAAPVVLITTPFVIASIATGYADITGSALLAVGTLTLGLWLEGAGDGHLWLGAILLAAAANTKDEDTIGAFLVLLALGVMIAVRGDRSRLRGWAGGCATWVILVAPWRVWTAAHSLTDPVQPPLPHALSPVFIIDRWSHLQSAATAIADQVVTTWSWQVSIFLAVCALALVSGTAARLAGFYLLSFGLLIASLLWLYATTSTSLAFLIPTSVYRTIDLFMVLTLFASAHILTRLLGTWDLALFRSPRRATSG
jgi:hypothetical protein